MVLRDSDSPQCDCLAGEGKDSLGLAGRVCIPHSCRDCVDPEVVCRRTHKTRTFLVVEAILSPEKPDPHKHHHVRTCWCVGWLDLALERAVGRCGVE